MQEQLQRLDPKVKRELKSHGYRSEKLLGEGTYGQVYVACKKNNCQFAVKIAMAEDPEDRAVAERDYYFLHQLQSSHKVPRLYNRFDTQTHYFMVLQRFQSNLLSIIEQRIEQIPAKITTSLTENGLNCNGVIHVDEISKIFALARFLGSAGIVHGDLKFDQFLFSAPDTIVITDFGFAGQMASKKNKHKRIVGDMGWSCNSATGHALPWKWCPAGPLTHLKTTQDAIDFNLWQLEANFFYSLTAAYLIYNPQTKRYSVFGGIHDQTIQTNPHLKHYVDKSYWVFRKTMQKRLSNV
jgi:serine/threonine protein kinase